MFQHLAYLIVRAEFLGVDPHALAHEERVVAHALAARNGRGPGRVHELVGGGRFEVGGKFGPAKARTRPEVDLLAAAARREHDVVEIQSVGALRTRRRKANPQFRNRLREREAHCRPGPRIIDRSPRIGKRPPHRAVGAYRQRNVVRREDRAESEGEIFKSFMQKWAQHREMVANMTEIVRHNGLFGLQAEEKMMRWMFASREEKSGKLWKAINNDNVLECQKMESNSVDLIVTSIPFSNHYEYTPTYNDFGHNEDNDKFFEQMDYLTPELMRILKPGRLACIHVKDRVLFGNATGDGMPTIDPFSEMTVFHYMKHGFRYMGRITVDTDVVRENNQTYRLGYTEMCKDGSKMGIGCPEYVLLFRKLPTDTSRAYADQPVTKDKSEYSLARWQIDAHASWKSSGNSLLSYEDMKGAGIDKIRHLFRNYEREHIYNYEEHVSFAEELEAYGKLPKTFMAVDPVSKKDWIWDDVARMRTLNTKQSQKKRQNHICPLQLDIVERLIERYSNKGELVFDPFGGIGTVPYCAIKLGRRGLSTELNYDYWKDGLSYLREAEMGVEAPTLFDLMAI